MGFPFCIPKACTNFLRRVEAKDTWNASVQVRQKSGQRKTLYYLEQLLIKYQAAKECSSIKLMHGRGFKLHNNFWYLKLNYIRSSA